MLKTIPGFDVLRPSLSSLKSAISRFRKANQVAAFLGLAPRVYSSGDTRRNGRITKCGSKLMRWMLVQSAWSAIRGSSNLRACYSQIGRRRGQKTAIIAIARKLATIAYHVLKESGVR
ncbi:MAG: IS110 family transposase [Candidatus Obscuribacter sp.]|nr:IS110 family transposase [Candidatus Obscuribacter sp.]